MHLEVVILTLLRQVQGHHLEETDTLGYMESRGEGGGGGGRGGGGRGRGGWGGRIGGGEENKKEKVFLI